jgi:hypothetical protein
VIWGDDKADYFSAEDWTGQISLIRHDKSGSARIDVAASRGAKSAETA